MALSETLRTHLSEFVSSHRVVLFMKGTRQMPRCGFSARVVQILNELLPDYETLDVLATPELRDGIKTFSDWPTIPQLYVNGKFVGGCDIVRDMHASGELQKLLGLELSEPVAPTITISESAAQELRRASVDARGAPLRLHIDAQYQHELYFGQRSPGDLEVCNSADVTLLIDNSSARRAEGLQIDLSDGPSGGFTIANPNAPPPVKQLTALELKAMLDRGEVTLFDVRPDEERAIAHISAARTLNAASQAYLLGLSRDTPIAFHCHVGTRSQEVAQQLIREGFRTVYNLAGGIDAWSRTVDPTVPRY